MAELEPLQTVASRAFKMIAEYAFPSGATAYCLKCRAGRHAPTSDIQKWMAQGFPTCRCGGKVTIDNPHVKERP